MHACGHPICELIDDGSCAIATFRSRGCRPNVVARSVAPEVFVEVRALLSAIDAGDAHAKPAAVRLAQIVRREALDDRSLLAHVRDEEPELSPALERLCVRRR